VRGAAIGRYDASDPIAPSHFCRPIASAGARVRCHATVFRRGYHGETQ